MKRLAALGLLLLTQCSPGARLESPKPAESPLDGRLREIGREYRGYGIVTQKFSWVMKQCRMQPVNADYSRSDDPETHGNKLYLLYAKDWNAYVSGIEEKQPVGQVIVKEAWEPEAVTEEREYPFPERGVRTPVYPVQREGKSYIPARMHGLFIMLKDEGGWRYGTVTPDGERVVQSGHIRSCFDCHRTAKPDSLFGLPGHPQDR